MGGLQLTPYKRLLAIRDGEECFFCSEKLKKHELTVDHILEISKGGSNRMENFALACVGCNQAMWNMSVVAKIKFRERKRGLHA
jgi:5-methylcytosine-specific restriction endonuclease McrA